MFGDITRQITNAHGYTTYHGSQNGCCRNTRGTMRTRSSSFSIYSHCSWGSRNTYVAPRNLGAYVSSIRIKKPDGNYLSVGCGGHSLSPARTVNNNFVRSVKTDGDRGHVIMQITSTSLFLLFNIEEVDEGDREQFLLDLYEAFVLPLDLPRRGNNMRVVEWVETGQDLPTLPSRDRSTGEGTRWKFAKTHLPRKEPAKSSTEAVVAQMKNHRRETLKNQIFDAARALKTNQQIYEDSLEQLHECRTQLVAKENEIEALKAFQAGGTDVGLDDPEVNALSEAINTHYEKLWRDGDNNIWALTKPIIMKFGQGTQDKLRVLAGKFYVKIKPNGDVRYYREDGKVAISSTNPVIAPHSYTSSICWGTYSSLIRDCQNKAEYAQLFILIATHIITVNNDDNYMNLRTYAEKLGLPSTEDPTVDLLNPPVIPETEEERLAKIPDGETVQPAIDEGEEVSVDELLSMTSQRTVDAFERAIEATNENPENADNTEVTAVGNANTWIRIDPDELTTTRGAAVTFDIHLDHQDAEIQEDEPDG